jgi:hypothetical protein
MLLNCGAADAEDLWDMAFLHALGDELADALPASLRDQALIASVAQCIYARACEPVAVRAAADALRRRRSCRGFFFAPQHDMLGDVTPLFFLGLAFRSGDPKAKRTALRLMHSQSDLLGKLICAPIFRSLR